MRPFATPVRCGFALLLVASMAGCTVEPLASPSASSPTSPVATSPSPSAPPATTPKVVRAKLPTESMPVRVLAISGEHILVQGDLIEGPARHLISHDSGRTWADAAFPCADVEGCDVVTPGNDQVGRAVDGIVIGYTYSARQLQAYSLVDNTPVGSPLTMAQADSVYDLAGGFALLYNSLTNVYTVRSLLDGTEHVMPQPDGASHRLFDDGSVLTSTDGAGTTWVRVAVDGTTTPVYSSAAGTGNVFVNGDIVWLQFSGRKAARLCMVDVVSTAGSCHVGVTKLDVLRAVGSTGALVSAYLGGEVRQYWFALTDGKLARLKPLGALKEWYPGGTYSAEKAAPLLSTWTSSATSLVRPGSTGTTTLPLDWAVRPVLPDQLALGSDTLLGTFATHSNSLSWTRPISTTGLGAQRRLAGHGQIAASGTRWALFTADRIRLYSSGSLVRSFAAATQGSSLTFAGDSLFTRPACRKAPLGTDEDCDSPETLYTSTGKRISVPPATEDANRNLLISRGGDTTVSSTTLLITDFHDPNLPPITLNLPNPGTDGYYTDIRLTGNWIATTQHLADGTMHPVVANYRTNTIHVNTANARFLALGDDIVVSALAHTTTLQVWELTTGTTQTLAASSTIVAMDGARVAYTTDSQVAIADFAG